MTAHSEKRGMSKYLTPRQVAERWQCHRSSPLRICRRFGYGAEKLGPSRSSARRFRVSEIERIERLFTANDFRHDA